MTGRQTRDTVRTTDDERGTMSATVVSWSEIDTYRQCPFKHQLAYRERWKAPESGDALGRGILWHEVLELHYNLIKQAQDKKAAPDLQEIHDTVVASVLWDARAGRWRDEQHAELVAWMYEGYCDHFGIDETWRVLAVEHAAEVPLLAAGGQALSKKYRIKVKIDLIVKDLDLGGIWLVDHKSHKDLPKDKELALDDQFGLYTWAMKQLGKPVVGALYSTARTYRYKSDKEQPLNERFDRIRLFRSDVELEAIARDASDTARIAYGWNPDKQGDPPRHPNKDTCRWRCDYTEPCLAGRKGIDTRDYLKDIGYVIDTQRH